MASSDGTGHLTTDELFRKHADFVARFLSRLGVPPGQLEDAIQEVFLVVHRNGGYRPGLAKPTSYLASIALRAAAKHRRRDGVARSRHSEAAVDAMSGEVLDPARAAQNRQDIERLQRALEQLAEPLRTTLLLVEMEGESCLSVAAGLGCPVGTIYWRLHQARKELRAALKTMDAPRRHATSAQPELDERAQPARSFMVFLSLDTFRGSEASRLLQLAREQQSPIAVDELMTRHHALIRAGAELPAWATGLTPHTASWLSVLGAGPIAAGVAAGGAIAAVALLVTQSPPPPPQLPREHPHVSTVQPALTASATANAAPEAPTSETPSSAAPLERAVTEQPPPTAREQAPRHVAPAVARESGERVEREAARAIAPSHELEAEREVEANAAAETEAETKPEPITEAAKPEAKPEPITEAAKRMGRTMTDAELAEMREIARAERLLAEDPKRALALTRAMAAGFPHGHFQEERAYLEVMALQKLGRTSEAQEKAAAFLRTHPKGLYSARVRKALAGKGE